MSYYISPEKTLSPARVVKRLRDFKGQEGKRYTVRTRVKVYMCDLLHTYEWRGGKLRKTDTSNTLWFGQGVSSNV